MTAALANPAEQSPEWKNLLGVCAALGEDVGFNPLWLRLALSVGLIWNWQAILVLYAALGMVVLISRLAMPNRRSAPSEAADERLPVEDETPLPLAA